MMNNITTIDIDIFAQAEAFNKPSTREDAINRIIYDKKCGLDETRDRFYSWCYLQELGSSVTARCMDVLEHQGNTTVKGTFYTSYSPWKLRYEFEIAQYSEIYSGNLTEDQLK